MEYSVLIAGSGGQGVMVIGAYIAQAAIANGCNASCMPAYGPEVRGGTANCIVKYSVGDELITPIAEELSAMILMNQVSVDKFKTYPKTPDCTIIINSSLAADASGIEKAVPVPCNDIAENLGNTRVANMVALGAYAALYDAFEIEHVYPLVKHSFEGKDEVIRINKAALNAGYSFVKERICRSGEV
ncbi:MAG: 2-oxoacid:acceptor oxidoreductase family protein [Clostridiaceae bacterium]|jgi:2-oxoglutarate ferredoxin oxidoreductase subunit gamma|nr:2-oxoacid:acceptor oxidoreductase family protein [Clostridiaceae bacterium]